MDRIPFRLLPLFLLGLVILAGQCTWSFVRVNVWRR